MKSLDETAKAAKLRAIEEQIPQCLKQGSDGRFYATEMGAQKLENLFKDQGFDVTVRVDEHFRFKITSNDPNLFSKS